MMFCMMLTLLEMIVNTDLFNHIIDTNAVIYSDGGNLNANDFLKWESTWTLNNNKFYVTGTQVGSDPLYHCRALTCRGCKSVAMFNNTFMTFNTVQRNVCHTLYLCYILEKVV